MKDIIKLEAEVSGEKAVEKVFGKEINLTLITSGLLVRWAGGYEKNKACNL